MIHYNSFFVLFHEQQRVHLSIHQHAGSLWMSSSSWLYLREIRTSNSAVYWASLNSDLLHLPVEVAFCWFNKGAYFTQPCLPLHPVCDNISQVYLITNLGRCLSHVSYCHSAFKKIEQMMSNSVSAQNFLALWTLNPGATSSCSAVWIHAIRGCFRKHNIL